MAIIMIDKEKCIGCGLCVKDCSRRAMILVDKKAEIKEALCNECSHCVAICPQNAVYMPQYNDDEILEYNSEDFSLDSKNLLNFIKFRRSLRQFKVKDVEAEKLNLIIEAGRYSPTGSNSQANRFIILKDKISEVREIALKTLHDAALDPNFDFIGRETYRNSWIKMYNAYIENKEVRLFYNAPAVVVIVSSDPTGYYQVNGGIAVSNMELVANSLGLGICCLGFLNSAAEINPKIAEILQIKHDEKFVISFTLGYPDIKYKRTVNRKPANVIIF